MSFEKMLVLSTAHVSFVWHTDKRLAVNLWRAWVNDQMGADLAAGPDRVFIVPCDRPDGQRIGILEWHKDVREV